MGWSIVIPGGVIRGRKNPLWYGLSDRLKRSRMGRPRSELSMKAGVADGVIRRIEEESNIPGLDTVEKVARALALAPAWLAYGIEGAPPTPIEEGAPLACQGIGERLRGLREERGLSARALARASGLADTAVRMTEEGRTLPGVDTAEALAKGLGVSPAWLAYGEGPQVLPKPPRRRKAAKAPQAERRRRRPAQGMKNKKHASTILRGG